MEKDGVTICPYCGAIMLKEDQTCPCCGQTRESFTKCTKEVIGEEFNAWKEAYDKQKAEEARIKAEEERKQAEEVKRKKEEAKRKADEAVRKGKRLGKIIVILLVVIVLGFVLYQVLISDPGTYKKAENLARNGDISALQEYEKTVISKKKPSSEAVNSLCKAMIDAKDLKGMTSLYESTIIPDSTITDDLLGFLHHVPSMTPDVIASVLTIIEKNDAGSTSREDIKQWQAEATNKLRTAGLSESDSYVSFWVDEATKHIYDENEQVIDSPTLIWCQIPEEFFSHQNGTLSLSKEGQSNKEKIEYMKIPSTHSNVKMTGIGTEAFSGCYNLLMVKIPASISNISENPFAGCQKLSAIEVSSQNNAFMSADGILFTKDGKIIKAYPARKTNTSFTIPSSVTSIGAGTFEGCTNLISISIPDKVKMIYSNTFKGCNRLSRVTLPSVVTGIGSSAFENCSQLKSMTLPSAVTFIGDNAFKNCIELTSVILTPSITKIGTSAFENCSQLTSVTIPPKVTVIENRTFFGCRGLKSMTIPSSVTKLGDNAFSGCRGLASLTLPVSVTKLGNYAFANCGSLTLYYLGSSTQWNNNVQKETYKSDYGTNITLICNDN